MATSQRIDLNMDGAEVDPVAAPTLPHRSANATGAAAANQAAVRRRVSRPFRRMMRLMLPGLCLLGSLSLISRDGVAQQDDVYVARDVPVQATAATPTQARQVALSEGRLEGLKQVLATLSGAAEESGGQAGLPEPTQADAERLALDFSVANERTTATDYIADVTVRFDGAGVRALLSSAGVSISGRRSSAIVVLPVWRSAPTEQAVLWDAANPWRDAWQQIADAEEGLVPIAVPFGDIEDVTAVDATTALSGDLATVASTMAGRYGAAGALTMEAVGDPTQGLVLNFRGVEPPFDALDSMTLTGRAGETGPELLARAIAETRNMLDSVWSRAQGSGGAPGAVGFGAGQMTVLAQFSGLGQWVDLQRRLGVVPQIRSVQVQAVTMDRAQILLEYAGTEPALAQALSGQGIAVDQMGMVWTLAPMGGLLGGAVPGLGGAVSSGTVAPAAVSPSPGFDTLGGFGSPAGGAGGVNPEPGAARLGGGASNAAPPLNPGTGGQPAFGGVQ